MISARWPARAPVGEVHVLAVVEVVVSGQVGCMPRNTVAVGTVANRTVS